MNGYNMLSSNVIKEEHIEYNGAAYTLRWHETNEHEIYEERLLHAEFIKNDVLAQHLRNQIAKEKRIQQHFLSVTKNNGSPVVFEYSTMNLPGSLDAIESDWNTLQKNPTVTIKNDEIRAQEMIFNDMGYRRDAIVMY